MDLSSYLPRPLRNNSSPVSLALRLQSDRRLLRLEARKERQVTNPSLRARVPPLPPPSALSLRDNWFDEVCRDNDLVRSVLRLGVGVLAANACRCIPKFSSCALDLPPSPLQAGIHTSQRSCGAGLRSGSRRVSQKDLAFKETLSLTHRYC